MFESWNYAEHWYSSVLKKHDLFLAFLQFCMTSVKEVLCGEIPAVAVLEEHIGLFLEKAGSWQE